MLDEEEGQRDEEARQQGALSNLRRLLGEYGFAATVERPIGNRAVSCGRLGGRRSCKRLRRWCSGSNRS